MQFLPGPSFVYMRFFVMLASWEGNFTIVATQTNLQPSTASSNMSCGTCRVQLHSSVFKTHHTMLSKHPERRSEDTDRRGECPICAREASTKRKPSILAIWRERSRTSTRSDRKGDALPYRPAIGSSYLPGMLRQTRANQVPLLCLWQVREKQPERNELRWMWEIWTREMLQHFNGQIPGIDGKRRHTVYMPKM